MIDGGLFLMVLGAIGMIVKPLKAVLAHRRWVKSTEMPVDRLRDVTRAT